MLPDFCLEITVSYLYWYEWKCREGKLNSHSNLSLQMVYQACTIVDPINVVFVLFFGIIQEK